MSARTTYSQPPRSGGGVSPVALIIAIVAIVFLLIVGSIVWIYLQNCIKSARQNICPKLAIAATT
jgi:hypothetical protein